MAPTDEKDLVRRYYDEVLSGRRRELLDELLAPDFLSHAASGQRFDRTAYVAAVAATHAAFPDLVVTIEDQIAERDKVATRWSARATHMGPFAGLVATGRMVTVSAIHIHRVADGRLAEHWEQIDLVGLLRQLR